MEYNLCDELSKTFNNYVFKNPEVEYQINALIDAMGVYLESGIDFQYPNKAFKNKENDYSMMFTLDNLLTNKIEVLGVYDNLIFCLKKEFMMNNKNHLKRTNTSFEIHLSVNIYQNKYTLLVDNKGGYETFLLRKYDMNNIRKEEIVYFVVHRNDFENVLELLMNFKENPDFIFDSYKEITKDKVDVPYNEYQRGMDCMQNIVVLRNIKKYK